MKQSKKLTNAQKKLVSKCGLNPNEWACMLDDNFYLHIRNKETGKIKIIDKKKGEVISHEKY